MTSASDRNPKAVVAVPLPTADELNAALVHALMRGSRADALRAAADAMEQRQPDGSVPPNIDRSVMPSNWLRSRAAEIEKGEA